MKRIVLSGVCMLLACLQVFSQNPFPVNYDESKVAAFTIPDPLVFTDGHKVRNAADWGRRRQEILELFQNEMYGRMPAASPIYLEKLDEGVTAAGFGTRRQVRMYFREDHSGPHIDWLIVTPNFCSGPFKTVMLLNYYGNHTILKDPEVLVTGAWLRNNEVHKITGHHASEESRGDFATARTESSKYPVDMLLSRGYALVTACYGEVGPDPDRTEFRRDEQDALARSGGVFELWPDMPRSKGSSTTSLMAWAWALCRGMDMIEQDPSLDAKRVIVTGCSRLGKAALIAGAFDERFPVVVPVQTGGGGVPLAKRNFGEVISTEIVSFPHWYCGNYDKYAGHEDSMPFDQNMFISCVAPRALFVEGFDQPWFDTKGEWLSVKSADTVWKKLHLGGLPKDADPRDAYNFSAIGEHLAYYHRTLEHGIAMIDWTLMLDFAEKNFKK